MSNKICRQPQDRFADYVPTSILKICRTKFVGSHKTGSQIMSQPLFKKYVEHCLWVGTRPAPAKRQQLTELELYISFLPHYFMPKGQFYALAIFVMGRLGTTGAGLKPWGGRRACSHDYPMALDPLLHWEQKPAHDFLFLFRFKYQTIMTASRYVTLWTNGNSPW